MTQWWIWSLGWTLTAHARKPEVPKVPSVAEVVESEGFEPTPSQSDLYRPGAVLVPNERGGHDEVVGDCILAEPTIAPMAQSSIAATLSAGVTARLGATSAAAQAGVEKRLTFIDPEQRTIGLGDLTPTADCRAKLETAGRIRDLSDAVVVHDVLVAIVQNTVCTRADASGGVVALGQAEAASFSECVQESDAQIPLGFKGVPLAKVVAPAPEPGAATLALTESTATVGGATCPWASITSSAANGNSLVLNGQSFNVKGDEATMAMASQLRACGEGEAALHFEEWRRRTHQKRVAWAVVFYGWAFVPGYSKKAEAARVEMLRALD